MHTNKHASLARSHTQQHTHMERERERCVLISVHQLNGTVEHHETEQWNIMKQPVKTETDIAILMDSNRKFLQEEKLFPGRKTTKLWCPKTGDALRILSDSSFGTPSHIIIHTGTNDLRREQERVGQLICSSSREGYRNLPQHKDHHIYPPTPQRHSPRHHPESQR